jgi:hypothetical protein
VLNERVGGVVNAAAGLAAVVVVAWTAWWGSRRVVRNQTSGVELEGVRRSGLIGGVRSRWIGMRDDNGRLSGEGKLAQDLALGNELEIFLKHSTADGAASSASLIEAWNSAGYSMVLTGAPGAGKSVQLLLLAEKLLNDAELDPRAGVPVIVSLPAWQPSGKRRASTDKADRPFEEWLVAELNAKFRLPKEHSRTWLAEGKLIPILDGLDETPAYDRQLLFDQVTNWVKDEERSPAAWALGCRDQEYAELDPNYNRMGSRSTFWSVKAISDEQRTQFLLNAGEEMNGGWRPVVDALERGEAPHLTAISEGEQGVLATPLGLTIAVEAYQSDGRNDWPTPTDLLNPQGNWDRLWTQYVSHRYLLAHRDPDDDAGEIGQPYGFDDARRWLATLASEEIGIGREIDVIHIKPPNRPTAWINLWSFVKDTNRIEDTLIWYGTFWGLLFVAFGALIGWQGWGGTIGFALVFALAVICGLTLKVAGLPKYIERTRYTQFMEALKKEQQYRLPAAVQPQQADDDASSRDVEREAVEDDRPDAGSDVIERENWSIMFLIVRSGHQYFAFGTLFALPALLILAAGSFWPGAVLAGLINLLYSIPTGLIKWLFGAHFQLTPHLGPTAGVNAGVMTGVALAAMIAGLAWLTCACAVVVRFINLYRKRNLLDRTAQPMALVHSKYFWWLDVDDPRYFSALYKRWTGKRLLLRWWCYGSPIRSRKPTGLIPRPKDWDSFLGWAAYRGYLRRVGTQYVWLHETLRIWFRKYLDLDALATLGSDGPAKVAGEHDARPRTGAVPVRPRLKGKPAA